MDLEKIRRESQRAILELLEIASLESGALFILGVSTSELWGEKIGTNGRLDLAQAVFSGLYPALLDRGIQLAVQCCEHLNRALVVEEIYAKTHGLEIVHAIPVPNAGGAMAAYAWGEFTKPVLVETVKAQAGLDIGQTMIGMHLAPVAVPVRLGQGEIGKAPVLGAYSRPKQIGGARAVYQ